jgi:hypothetical protein
MNLVSMSSQLKTKALLTTTQDMKSQSPTNPPRESNTK